MQEGKEKERERARGREREEKELSHSLVIKPSHLQEWIMKCATCKRGWRSLIKVKTLSYYNIFLSVNVIGFSKRLRGKVCDDTASIIFYLLDVPALCSTLLFFPWSCLSSPVVFAHSDIKMEGHHSFHRLYISWPQILLAGTFGNRCLCNCTVKHGINCPS